MAAAGLASCLAIVGCGGDDGEAEGDDESRPNHDGDTGEDEELPPIDPEICEDLAFENVIDEAVCDEVQGRGVDPVAADDVEVCRRLYVDLTGAAPTKAEYEEDCAGRNLDDIVDDLMGRPQYVELGRQVWADKFLMTSDITYYEYLEDLDLLVQDLYTGAILLPEFAEITTTHPGFTGRFDGVDMVGYSFLAFLGRDAAPHERNGLEPLWHMWQPRYVESHPDYYFGYSPMVANTVQCMGIDEAQCHSDLWGHHSVVIPPVEEGNYDYDGVNALDVDTLTPDQWDAVRLPGRLIAQQPTFYETAADEALQRYLGYDAGAMLPLARQRLTDMLAANGGDIREIEREVLTSQLYWTASAFPDPEGTSPDDGAPPYWHGPMKQMTAEAWINSAAKLGAIDAGRCDPRYPSVQGATPNPGDDYMLAKFHPNEYPKDTNWPDDSNRPDYTYRELAQLLGGCPDQQGQLRFTGTGVMIAIGQDAIGQGLCVQVAEGAPLYTSELVLPIKTTEGLTAIADHAYEQVMLRPPPEEVREAIDAGVGDCLADPECNNLLFGLFTCNSLLKSAPFIFN